MITLFIMIFSAILTLFLLRRIIESWIDWVLIPLGGVFIGFIIINFVVCVSVGMVGTKIEIRETDNDNVIKIVEYIDNDFLQKNLLVFPWSEELQFVEDK